VHLSKIDLGDDVQVDLPDFWRAAYFQRCFFEEEGEVSDEKDKIGVC
jgi:hypothetical protein